eukprot:13929823-Ditylum_brightwellii.AAC.1
MYAVLKAQQMGKRLRRLRRNNKTIIALNDFAHGIGGRKSLSAMRFMKVLDYEKWFKHDSKYSFITEDTIKAMNSLSLKKMTCIVHTIHVD